MINIVESIIKSKEMLIVGIPQESFIVSIINDSWSIRFKTNMPYKCDELREWLATNFVDHEHIFACMPIDDSNHVSTLALKLPGVKNKVKHPVKNKPPEMLYNIIMDLNDCVQKDKERAWTREEIADWIESVMNLEDITFTAEMDNEKQIFDATRIYEVQRILSIETEQQLQHPF